jgi:hypothetical protein
MNHLHRPLLGRPKRGAQYFMPLHHRLQRTLQSPFVQLSLQPQSKRQVVLTAAAFNLVQYPKPLLRKGQSQRPATICAADTRNDSLFRLDNLSGQPFQSGLFKDFMQQNFYAKSGQHPGDQPHGRQRVPSEFKKVGFGTDGTCIQVQHFRPDCCHRNFHRRRWRYVCRSGIQ